VLESFRQFSLLFEKSNSQMMKRMFGDPKEKPTVSNLDLEEITRNIFDYQRAKHEIEKLCIDEKTFSFFQVRTKVAKEALTQKASEILGAILTRSADIVTDNITRITQAYQDMCDRMLSSPKNEIELVELKNFIAETEVNLAKIRNEVDCVLTYLDLFEKVSHPYSEKNIEYLSLLIGRNFWYLKSWP
jgi:dynein heavy chain